MRYGITKIVMGFPGFIEIDEAEYNLIKNARENLYEALFLEEKLDYVTENFYEYETELLTIASRMMIFHNEDYFSMNRERSLISRRIVNLLSAGKMYLDQSIQHIENMYGADSDNLNLIKKEIAFQYDQSLGYRVMEALRNYVQHRGFPIHNTIFSHERVESDDDFRLLHRVIPYISISELEADDKFKKGILKELKNIQNKDLIDAKPLIREYVEGIGKIQEKVRELIRLDVTNWEKTLDDTIAKFQNEFGEDASLAGLAIVTEKDNGDWGENKTIFKEFIERRQELEWKNSLFINLRISYASNEIRKKDA
jgi:hypothetical protein